MMVSLKRSPTLIGLALALSGGAASAQGLGYGDYAYDGYDFAEPVVRGSYLGAPFTRTPHPRELVPTVWGYGTYGIPTVTGIRSAPVGVPTVYVIDAQPSGARRGDRRMSRHDQADMRGRGAPASGGGARVIQVAVPRR